LREMPPYLGEHADRRREKGKLKGVNPRKVERSWKSIHRISRMLSGRSSSHSSRPRSRVGDHAKRICEQCRVRIFYVLRAGCAWRMLPRAYAPRSTVYGYFARFREVVRHAWRARGEWVPHGDLNDLSTVWFTYERIKAEPKRFRGVLPRRWVVERTLAWMGRYRRMSKDYEYLTSRSESMVCLMMIRLMLRRLTDASETARENAQRRRAA
jgi:transposase